MVNTATSVSHDHDYCASPVEERKAIDPVVENLLDYHLTSSPSSMDAVITKLDPLCLSPAYSCDSGIDSFSNDLAQEFGGEGDDLLNFLLEEDDFHFGLDSTIDSPQESLTKNLNNSSVKMTEAYPTKKTVKPSVGKTSTGDTDELSEFERNHKNAVNAKENRRKKKIYIEELEKEVGQLRNDKNVLTGKANIMEKKVTELQDEVDYLKSVLANQSMLSKLIENVSMIPGVSLSTSFCSSRKSTEKENDVECEKENSASTRSSSRKRACDRKPVPSAKRGRASTNALGARGVCLHVNQSKVSLEFCQHCSKMAEV